MTRWGSAVALQREESEKRTFAMISGASLTKLSPVMRVPAGQEETAAVCAGSRSQPYSTRHRGQREAAHELILVRQRLVKVPQSVLRW